MRAQYAGHGLLGMDATTRAALAPIAAPLFAVAAARETPLGETAAKMESWRGLTSAGFQLAVVKVRRLHAEQAGYD